MKKKRITALLLALFMVTNETAYPFGAENTVVEENTEEMSLRIRRMRHQQQKRRKNLRMRHQQQKRQKKLRMKMRQIR